ncbi:hypothetical protein [Apilactobacillus xinyiensis]|uniref:hypothetical protein n=1 Tax=Apilactobacillus xinyiensis TaxID=2841032 RepID=UPI001C7DADB7|nr:hypothetical protein [Apilactobacillus xinyiensis]
MRKTKKLSKEEKQCIDTAKLLAKFDSTYMMELASQGFSLDTALQMLHANKVGMIDSEE